MTTSNKLRIIGLSGTNGAGKDVVGHTLALNYNYLFVSVSDLLREEAKKRGVPADREHLRAISAEWRRGQGLGVLVDRAYELFQELTDKYDGLVMASLRNAHEADRVHELGGTMVWVDAESRIRYERIQRNLESRGRAAEDGKTYEQFLAEEAAEMTPPAGSDEAALNMGAVKERCDIFLDNAGDEITEFQASIPERLGLTNQ